MDVSISQIVQLNNDSAPNSDTDASTDTSIATTPLGSGTPTGSVVVPSRDRSGTIIARPVWDRPPTTTTANAQTTTPTTITNTTTRRSPPSTDISRPDTETEDDGDGDADIDMDRGSSRIDDSDVASASASPSPERPPRRLPLPLGVGVGRRAVGIVTDDTATGAPPDMGGLDTDAHIIINDAGAGEVVGGVGVEVGVEDGIVSLEANDDFAMGAPPGAPGAINAADGGTPRGMNFVVGAGGEGGGRRRNANNNNTNVGEAPDVTPRAGVVGLPMMVGGNTTIRGPAAPAPAVPATATAMQHHHHHQRNATIRGGRVGNPDALGPRTDAGAIAAAIARTGGGGGNNGTTTTTNNNNGGGHHTRDTDSSGPYRDEDVLLSLQLLAYLSKYPHVRQAFYKPRVTFHPASLGLTSGARYGVAGQGQGKKEGGGKEKEREGGKEKEREGGKERGGGKEGFFRAFANVASGSGRGKERANPSSSSSPPSNANSSPSSSVSTTNTSPSTSPSTATPLRQTNVFSLVERFTFKPSSTETDLPNPPPRLPPEIQYWAGVIMRNACRKDDSRGGIRQCANSEFPFPSFFCLFVKNTMLITRDSALWTMGDLPTRICEMQKVQESQVLWQGMSEYGVERGTPVLV